MFRGCTRVGGPVASRDAPENSATEFSHHPRKKFRKLYTDSLGGIDRVPYFRYPLLFYNYIIALYAWENRYALCL